MTTGCTLDRSRISTHFITSSTYPLTLGPTAADTNRHLNLHVHPQDIVEVGLEVHFEQRIGLVRTVAALVLLGGGVEPEETGAGVEVSGRVILADVVAGVQIAERAGVEGTLREDDGNESEGKEGSETHRWVSCRQRSGERSSRRRGMMGNSLLGAWVERVVSEWMLVNESGLKTVSGVERERERESG